LGLNRQGAKRLNTALSVERKKTTPNTVFGFFCACSVSKAVLVPWRFDPPGRTKLNYDVLSAENKIQLVVSIARREPLRPLRLGG
jgi:hypothetical protein